VGPGDLAHEIRHLAGYLVNDLVHGTWVHGIWVYGTWVHGIWVSFIQFLIYFSSISHRQEAITIEAIKIGCKETIIFPHGFQEKLDSCDGPRAKKGFKPAID